MGHRSSKSEYFTLQQRLDKNPLGAPANQALFQILEELFTPEECRLAAAMPLKFATAEKIAGNAGMEARRVREILPALVAKGLVIDFPGPDGNTYYFLNPPIVGFFEFTMMRVRTDIDQKKIARLMWQYIHQDPDCAFFNMLAEGPTYIGRPLVHEDMLAPDVHSEVLDYEKASQVIADAGVWAVGLCHCRHVKQHVNQACDSPLNNCLSLGQGARYLVHAGIAQTISREKTLDILAQARELDMVQMADNVKHKPTFICNCCKCCCAMMDGFRTVPMPTKVVTSNYEAAIDEQACTGCGKCADACPIEIISLVPASPTDKASKRKKRARVNIDICLGCGVCARQCRFNAIRMRFIGARAYTPDSILEKMMMQAIERGKLQNLLFDDPTRMSHQALGKILGVLLKLPPARQLLARQQTRSRFVGKMIETLARSKKGWMAKV